MSTPISRSTGTGYQYQGWVWQPATAAGHAQPVHHAAFHV